MNTPTLSPIQLPFRLKCTDRALAQWGFEVHRCLTQLKDRRSIGGSGGGSGVTSSSEAIPPLTLTQARPGHIEAPESGPSEGERRFWLTMGNINGIRLSNFQDPIDLPEGEDRWIFAQCNLSSANSLTLTGAQIVVGSSETEYQTPDWPNNGTRPGNCFKLLATWHEDILSNTGAGNLQLTEVVSDIRMGAAMGESLIIKQLFWARENYG